MKLTDTATITAITARILCLILSTVLCAAKPAIAAPAGENPLKPIMVNPGKLIQEDDFSKPKKKLDRKVYQGRQATPWQIKDGVLYGTPNSAEVQAARPHHKGKEARVLLPKTPMDFVTSFSIRFNGGNESPIVPFVEFGHHVCRVTLQSKGTQLIVESETLQVAGDSEYKLKKDVWYHMLAEMKDDQFVFQIKTDADKKPITLFTRHRSFPGAADHYIGVAGTTQGTVEIDNLKLWEAGAFLDTWEATRSTMPTFKPIPTPKALKPKKKPGNASKQTKKKKKA